MCGAILLILNLKEAENKLMNVIFFFKQQNDTTKKMNVLEICLRTDNTNGKNLSDYDQIIKKKKEENPSLIPVQLQIEMEIFKINFCQMCANL